MLEIIININIQPNPRTLDEYTPHQYWSANFILLLSLILFSYRCSWCAFLLAGVCEPESLGAPRALRRIPTRSATFSNILDAHQHDRPPAAIWPPAQGGACSAATSRRLLQQHRQQQPAAAVVAVEAQRGSGATRDTSHSRSSAMVGGCVRCCWLAGWWLADWLAGSWLAAAPLPNCPLFNSFLNLKKKCIYL